MPTDFTSFFVAVAGAAAALVGLLFVAVSISPERNVGPGAPLERQAVAEGAFTALTNAFFVSLGALIPNIGWPAIAITAGVIALWHTVATGLRMLRASGDFLVRARRLFYVASGVAVYGFQCFYGFQALGTFGRAQPEAVYSLAYVLMAVLAIGLLRAWQLLGAPRRGFLGWLSPLQPPKSGERIADTPHG